MTCPTSWSTAIAKPTSSGAANCSRPTYVFTMTQHLMQIINRIVSRVGRRIDESSPMVDARLPDGSRVNAVIPPLAIDGPALCIRRFGAFANDISYLVQRGTLTPEMVHFLRAAVGTRLNILDQRRHRHRQDHLLELPVILHSRRRTHHHDRRRRRIAHAAAPRTAAGNAPIEHRGSGRSDDQRAVQKHPADAAGSDQ